MGEYQRPLAAGDIDAIVAAFEPDGYAREPAGGEHVDRGSDGLSAFYEQLFSNGGSFPSVHFLHRFSAIIEGSSQPWAEAGCLNRLGSHAAKRRFDDRGRATQPAARKGSGDRG